MNVPVDVLATFNTIGAIKPTYVRLEDKEHMLHTHKIEDILYTKEEKYAGIAAMIFCCNIRSDDCKKMIKLRYQIETHTWVLVSSSLGEGYS